MSLLVPSSDMIPSIDYLTLVVSGAIMLAGASNLMEDGTRVGYVLALLGFFLFSVGTIRAFMSAFGL
jgi:hypothetical protein